MKLNVLKQENINSTIIPDYDLCIEMSSQNIEPSPDVNGVNYFGRMDFTVLTLFAVSLKLCCLFHQMY